MMTTKLKIPQVIVVYVYRTRGLIKLLHKFPVSMQYIRFPTLKLVPFATAWSN